MQLIASTITDDSKIVEDLGADSLHTVELVMLFEKEFDIEIPDEDTDNLITVGDVKRYSIHNEQMFMGIILILGLATFYLYNQNQTLSANNLALEGAVEEQQTP